MTRSSMTTPPHSPASLLLVHVGDDGVLGEGQLVVSLGLVLVHGSYSALQPQQGALSQLPFHTIAPLDTCSGRQAVSGAAVQCCTHSQCVAPVDSSAASDTDSTVQDVHLKFFVSFFHKIFV